jgi:hypothetical protein
MTLRRSKKYWSKKVGGGLAYTPFADQYPLVLAIHSLKLDRSDYLGPLIRVVNDSTLVETDIFPDANGLILDADLLALGVNIFVLKFYDQKASFDLVAISATKAQIVSEGAVVKSGAFTACYISSNIYSFNHLGALNNTSPKSGFYCLETSNIGSQSGALKAGTRGQTSTGWLFRWASGSLVVFNTGGSGSVASSVPFTINTRKILAFCFGSSFATIYANGSALNSGSFSGGSNKATYEFGNDTSGGQVQAFMAAYLFGSDQTANSSDIQNSINSYYSTY